MENRVFEIVLYQIRRAYRKALQTLLNNESHSNDAHHDDSNHYDSDVMDEQETVENMSHDDISSYNLVMRNISHDYGHFLAVKQVSAAISELECFGLLGVNVIFNPNFIS